MSEDPSELRGYGDKCLAFAKTTLDDGARAKWLEMAQHWFRVADKAQLKASTVQQQQQPQPHTKKE
jgi:hypothetical protein